MQGTLVPDKTHTDNQMSIGDHLEELRKRLMLAVIGAGVCITLSLLYATKIILWLEKPYVEIMKAAGLEPQLQSLSPMEGFISYLKIATYAGLVLASPWIFYQLWKFVSAGLYPNEKRYVHLAAPASAILFIGGAALSVFLVAPLTLQFCINFNKDWLGIASAFTFQNYMSFMVSMMVAFGISFQTPIAMFFLNKFGMLPLSLINKSRRYVILGVVVAASIITPGQDMISLSVLSVALYGLFEIGFLSILIAGRKE